MVRYSRTQLSVPQSMWFFFASLDQHGCLHFGQWLFEKRCWEMQTLQKEWWQGRRCGSSSRLLQMPQLRLFRRSRSTRCTSPMFAPRWRARCGGAAPAASVAARRCSRGGGAKKNEGAGRETQDGARRERGGTKGGNRGRKGLAHLFPPFHSSPVDISMPRHLLVLQNTQSNILRISTVFQQFTTRRRTGGDGVRGRGRPPHLSPPGAACEKRSMVSRRKDLALCFASSTFAGLRSQCSATAASASAVTGVA